jgi:hypothetical protein
VLEGRLGRGRTFPCYRQFDRSDEREIADRKRREQSAQSEDRRTLEGRAQPLQSDGDFGILQIRNLLLWER